MLRRFRCIQIFFKYHRTIASPKQREIRRVSPAIVVNETFRILGVFHEARNTTDQALELTCSIAGSALIPKLGVRHTPVLGFPMNPADGNPAHPICGY